VADTRHQIVVRLDPDDRLVAAVGGAARYLADAAGLENKAILQFQASVVAACRHCFHCHTSDQPCGITLRRAPDRLEVEVALPGTEPPPPEEKPSWEGIDEVHCETRPRAALLRLTKYVPPAPPAQ
jgi:hypothetical protein